LPFSEAPQAPAMALDLFLRADHDMRAPIGRLARSIGRLAINVDGFE
jgi:hypothetical protein